MQPAVPIDVVTFQAMLERAREFHEQVNGLGLSGAGVRAYVHGHLHRHPEPPELPPGLTNLGDEIVEHLTNPMVSPWQAHQLEQTFFLER
jgi:hypothetical protein